MAYKQDKLMFLDSFLNIFTFLLFGYTFLYDSYIITYKYYKWFTFLNKEEFYTWDSSRLNYYLNHVIYYSYSSNNHFRVYYNKGKFVSCSKPIKGFIAKSKKFKLSHSPLSVPYEEKYSKPLFR